MNGIKYRSADEMKDSGIEWLGRLVPLDWKVYRAKYIWKKENRPVQPDDMVVTAFRDGQVTLRENRRTEGFTFAIKEIGYQRVLKGDLVISAMDAYAGAMGISESTGKCSPVYSVCSPFKPVEQAYYGYLLKDMAQKNYILSLAKGIRERSTDFRYAEFGDTILTYPTILEQRKIAHFLDIKTAQFDSIIAKKEQLIAKLEEAKKSLISEVVTGKVKIVDGQLVPRQPEEMKDSGVEWLGMIPKEWKIKRTKYIFVESGSKSRQGKEVPLSMSQKFGLIKSEDMESIPNQAISNVGNKICKVGDLVFNKLKSHLGVFAVSQFYGIVSPDYAVYSPLDCVNSKYYEYLFKTPTYITQFNKRSKGVGAGLTRLYTDDLFDIFCLAPTNSQQNEIVKYLETLIEKTRQVQAKTSFQIELLKSAKQSLISEAVTGKIDLRDWEINEQGGAS